MIGLFKKIVFIFLSTLVLLIIIEGLARFIFNTSVSKIQNFSEHGCHLKKNQFIPNCIIKIKRWENKEEVLYMIDKDGFRTSSLPYSNLNKINLVFLGDSFTYGEMNNENKNYVYLFSKYLNSYYNTGYVNQGFPGLGFFDVFNKIKNENLDKFDYIIYGITPNDVYSLQTNLKKQNVKIDSNNFEKIILYLKSKIYLRSLQAFMAFILENDKIYKTIWEKRSTKDFINHSDNIHFEKKYSIIEEKLMKLQKEKKKKLILLTIPQQIQIVHHNLGNFEKSKVFEQKIGRICKNTNVKCILTLNNLKSLDKINNTHFTIDGHLTPFGNKFIIELIKNDISFKEIFTPL